MNCLSRIRIEAAKEVMAFVNKVYLSNKDWLVFKKITWL